MSEYTGLFGHTSNKATIIDVEIEKSLITGDEIVGALVGEHQDSTIVHADINGTITGTSAVGGVIGTTSDSAVVQGLNSSAAVSGSRSIGGLIGSNSDNTKVDNARATGVVNGSEDIGGLIGAQYTDSTVSESYANSTVSGSFAVGGLVGKNYGTVNETLSKGTVSGQNRVGGLVGYSVGDINNSYARAPVDGNSSVGGLVGLNYAPVNHSYATGSVTGNESVGGLIGSNNHPVNRSYYDLTATGQTDSTESVTGLTTDQMTGSAAETNMTGLNFGNIWDTQPDGYPILAHQADDKSDQSGSAQVQISNISLTPQSVNSNSESTHQLTFEAQNVSADGNEDEFDITFPDRVELISYSDVAIDEKSSGVEKVANTLEFSVNPSGGGSTQIAGELNVTLSVTT